MDHVCLCPACAEPLWIVQQAELTADFCASCKGIWLDAGELEILLELAGAPAGEVVRALEGSQGEKVSGGRRCPRCLKKLRQLEFGGTVPLTLDSCPRGHGLWFDRGEVVRMLELTCRPALEGTRIDGEALASAITALLGGLGSTPLTEEC